MNLNLLFADPPAGYWRPDLSRAPRVRLVCVVQAREIQLAQFNPDTMALLSHEEPRLVGYYENLKEHFGTTIVAMFTDEPNPLGRNPRREDGITISIS